jgi:CelD/BcsL family acetyltransferase involved in cellulose biosynthesis
MPTPVTAVTDHVARGPALNSDRSARPLQLEQIESFEAAREDWTSLAARTGNFFATWEWNRIWSERFLGPSASEKLMLTRCRLDDGRAVGLLPLYTWRRRPLRIVRFLGHHGGDQLGPICSPEDRVEVAGALRRVLEQAGTDIFVGERLAVEEGWSSLLTATPIHREASPILRYTSRTWDELLQSRSRNFREQARRKERRLARAHEVRFRLADDAARLSDDLDVLFALHRTRWAGGRTTFSGWEAFHRDVAACAFERGWLRLWFLDVDGEPRAACYGFRFGRVESFYQGGRDPRWNDHSVGFIVLLHAIREALSDGMTEYRLLRGHEPYKYRFANTDSDLETIALTRGMRSRLALRLASAGQRSRAFRALAGVRG